MYVSIFNRMYRYYMYIYTHAMYTLQRFDSHSQLTTFTSVEIHVIMGQEDTSSRYRIFLHNGTLEKKDKVKFFFK